MIHSTNSEQLVATVPASKGITLSFAFSTLCILLLSVMSISTFAQQGVSSDPSYVYHHLNGDSPVITSFDDCAGSPLISEGDWIITSNSDCDGFHDFGNWVDVIDVAPSGCTNSFWTGGFCDSEWALNSATQFVEIPNDDSVELCFEYFSLTVEGDQLDDYSYISVDGTELWTMVHSEANNSNAYEQVCLDLSAYAGQTVELELGHVQGVDDGAQGNVFFGCLNFGCTEDNCDPAIDLTCPADITLNCDDSIDPLDIGIAIFTATDCTGDVSLTFTDDQVSNDSCPLILARTWVATDGDITEMCTQLITLEDTSGPVIEAFENPVLVSCLEEVPGPEDLTSLDDCSGLEYEVEFFETNNGELTDTCNLSVAFGPGDDWALWLPVLHAEGKVSSANFIFDENGGQFNAFNDGTANLVGTVVNDVNPAESFELDLWFQNKSDWATWSSMGRFYKDDLGCAQPDLYEDWTYYEMANVVSTATGQGDLAGDILHFYHMPSNFFFGFQIGMGANNKNCDYGMSGWFTYEGVVDGMFVEGNGDVNVDAECGPVNEFDCPHLTEYTYFYFAQDDCGNITVESQTILVNDETGPDFVVFPEDLTVDCDEYPVEIAEVEAVDNCVGDVEVDGPVDVMFPGDCPNEWVVERTWTAVDICGNVTEQTQTINVIDDEAPEFDGLPADETVECDAIPEAPEVTVSDNCSEVENIDFWMDEEIIDGDCTGEYTIIRTWYAIDECDNENSHAQTITVIDTTAPVFDAYDANIEMPCDDISLTVDLTATDNCGEVDVTFEDELTDEGCAGTILRTYTATDDCGNSATALQTITLLDGEAPYFTSFPADDSAECDSIPDVSTDYSYDDNCTEVTINFDGEEILPGNCAGNYTIIRTWTITDNCGNSTSDSQTINVHDTTPPVFTFIPQGGEYSCDEELPTENAEAEDNCSGATVTYDDVMTPGDCENSYSVERTFTAVDGCGNSASESIEFFIYDNEAPEFTFVQADMTLECDEDVPAAEATAEDNCDGDVTIDVSEEIIDGDCPAEYTLIRTYTATDNCENSSEATQTITVVDTTAPEFVDYEFYTYVECEEIDDYTLEATDNCGDVTVEIIEEILNSGGCMGVLYRIYLATDECGNTTEVEQYIVITDTTAPELLNVPADATMECSDMLLGDDGNYFGVEPVTAEDNCALEVEIDYSEEMIDDGDDCVDSYIIIRTWVATDYCENQSSAQQTVTVVDTTNPEFVEFPADFTIECSEEMPDPETPLAEDNCDDDVTLEMTEETQAGDCIGESTLLRIWRAFDNCGNEAMMVQEITIVDTTAPEFTFVPADITYECDEAIADDAATAEDNCSDASIVVTDGEELPGDCPAEYSFVRTFTATDDCGNVATATQTITVVDTTAPVFDAYEVNIEMPCDQIDDSILVTATDNCSDFEITYEDSPVSGGCAGVVIRDYTATDACGNESYAQQIINLTDVVAPEWTSFPADGTVECDNVPAPSELLDAEDNCDDDVEITYLGEEIIDGNCAGNYTIIRTWVAIDDCLNENERSQTITVVDTTAPEFTFIPQGGEYSCDEALPTENAEADDNCSGATVTYDDVMTPGDCENSYSIERTFTAVDGCGNSASESIEFFIYDNEAPDFTSVAADLTLECSDDIPAPAASAEDNCDGDVTIDVAEEIIDGDCPAEYTLIRTYTATDNCENSSEATQTIIVVDTTSPVFDDYETQIEMPCDMIDETITVTATDNCGAVTITFEDQVVSGGCAGVIIRDYTATDECGNEAYAQQIINLTDEVAPTFDNFPADESAECDDVPAPAEGITASDNCDDDVEVTYQGQVITPGSCDGEYTIERTWLAIDNCLNETLETQTITVIDTTAPEFTFVPQGGEYSCDEDLPTTNAEATDNCSGATVDYADVMTPGDCPQSYTVTRTFTATDGCGNSTSTSIEFGVYDNEAPVFDFVPADYTAECDEVLVLEDAIASDNCGTVTIVEFPVTEPLQGCPQAYLMTRVFIAVDECGNESAASQTITVLDTTAPIFDDYETNIEMPCDDIDDNILVSATDNCGDVTITYEDSPVSGGCAGVLIRDYTAVDECGNEAYAQQIINLTDNVDPVLAGVPTDLSVECGNDIPEPADVTATDNCDDDLEVIFSESTEDLDCLYAIHRTWTVTDHCGNSASATQIITLIDTLAPEFDGGDYTIEAECDELVEVDEPFAGDICDENVDVTVDVVSTPGSCANEWTEVHTFTATDDCGNSSSLAVTVNFSDNTAPVFDFVPASYTAECSDVLEMLEPTAHDNCGDVTITEIPVQEFLGCDNSYLLTRAFIATDACGNQTAASQVITVLDTTPPTFDQDAEDATVECYGDAVIPELTASDNCGGAEVTSNVVETIDGCGNGTIAVSYLAIDECGNTAETSLTITILDTTAPEFEGDLPQDLVIDCDADVPAAAELTATDNCDDNITVTMTEELTGDLPAEGSIADCALSTGDSPYYNPDWSLWLQAFPNGDEFYSSDEAYFVEYPDGTAHLYGHVTSTQNANAGWDIDVWFMNGMDWDSWSTQAFPTSYKDDFNLAGDNYLDWTYYIVNGDSATLTGTGDYTGSLLTLAHAPSNLFYGYQVGIAANNTNEEYGNGGWFYYDGVLVENGVETEASGAGDFAFDADCCPRYEIVRTWTAEDCAGNTTSWTQTISFGDVIEDGAQEGVQNGGDSLALDVDENWATETVELEHSVYPNPVMGTATFSFTPVKNGKTSLEIFNLSGSKTMTVFNQVVEAGVTYKVPFSSGELAGGVYLYQIVNGDTVVTDKMIISK